MTKSECYSQISICNAGIEEDQKRSGNGKKKLIFMRIRTDAWNGDRKIWLIFCSCHSRKIRQTRDYFPQVKYVEGYVQDMDGISSGCRV